MDFYRLIIINYYRISDYDQIQETIDQKGQR
jgi:hypothetical protein